MCAQLKEEKLAVTAVVVTYNEAARLEECLRALNFCDQLIVIDLHSTDESAEIARRMGAELHFHEHVPIVEKLWPLASEMARNDWILRVDPDEILPSNIAIAINESIKGNEDIAEISPPIQYYFLGKPLDTTYWGGITYQPKMFNKHRIELTGNVHRGLKPKPGFKSFRLPPNPEYVIRHFWVDSIGQLISKHIRYIRHEGESRFKSGERFSLSGMVRESISILKYNLFFRKGILGGVLGIFLSFFHATYVFLSHLSLLKYEKTIRKTHVLDNNR